MPKLFLIANIEEKKIKILTRLHKIQVNTIFHHLPFNCRYEPLHTAHCTLHPGRYIACTPVPHPPFGLPFTAHKMTSGLNRLILY